MIKILSAATAMFSLLSFVNIHAAPYYAGDNPKPESSVGLNFTDAPTKSSGTVKSGNIAAFELEGFQQVAIPEASVLLNFPIYTATKDAAQLAGAAKSKTGIGNTDLGLIYSSLISDPNAPIRYGWVGSLEAYLPTARNQAAAAMSAANPTLDYYRYSPFTTTIRPRAGLYMSQTYFSLKTDIAYGYMYMSKTSIAGNDHNRNSWDWQLAASVHPNENLNFSLEYNTMWLDKATAGTRAKFLHAVAPSISGRYQNFAGNLFASFPIEDRTRDVSNVALGLNAAYLF